MSVDIKIFLPNRIDDVIEFEKNLREQESDWGWKIDEDYVQSVKNSFEDERFKHSISLLAYDGDKVVGRIDTTLIASHFDGSLKAYLDWICVLKSHRHRGVAQKLMEAVRAELKDKGVTNLVAIIAHNDESLRFYHAVANSVIQDEGIWIKI